MQKYINHFVDGRYREEFKEEIVRNNSKKTLFTEGGRIYPLKNTLEEIYCIMNDISAIPKCFCGKELSIKQYSSGFRQYCSTKCSNTEKGQNIDKNKLLVKKRYFNKECLTKEVLEKYINVYNCVDTNFYKMCDFEINSEEVYMIYHQTDVGKCVICEEPTTFINFREGYRIHCSHECSHKNEERVAKIITTSRLKDKNGLSSYDKMALKLRITNEKNGHWIPLSEFVDIQLYRRQVSISQWKHKDDIKKLDNFEKRGHANKGMYHLDHKFSIVEGFKQNIPPYIIGHICNLEMIVARNNLIKNKKCSITKEELLDSFFSFQ